VPSQITCVIWYPDVDQPLRVTAQLLAIGAGVQRSEGRFKEHVVSCPLTSHDIHAIPILASFIYGNSQPLFQLPVEVPARTETRRDFVVCVSVAYWHHDPHQIVEWMEMLRILGADMVTVYNNSLSEESARVLQYYDNQGLVDFRQSHTFVKDHGELSIHLHMSPVINDCMYRNMYLFRKVIITDLDELITPRQHLTYKDLVTAIETQQTLMKQPFHPARHYTFRNAYFFTDLAGEDKNQSKWLKTQRHQRRLPPSGPGYSVKSIIDPTACTNMHNHMCWGQTRLYGRAGDRVDVDVELGMNQHYKKCHFDKYERPGRCAELAQQAVTDDTMLRFRQPLIAAVQQVLKELSLEPL